MWQVVVTWIQNILIPDTVTGQPQGLDTSNFERKSSSFESQNRKVNQSECGSLQLYSSLSENEN